MRLLSFLSDLGALVAAALVGLALGLSADGPEVERFYYSCGLFFAVLVGVSIGGFISNICADLRRWKGQE